MARKICPDCGSAFHSWERHTLGRSLTCYVNQARTHCHAEMKIATEAGWVHAAPWHRVLDMAEIPYRLVADRAFAKAITKSRRVRNPVYKKMKDKLGTITGGFPKAGGRYRRADSVVLKSIPQTTTVYDIIGGIPKWEYSQWAPWWAVATAALGGRACKSRFRSVEARMRMVTLLRDNREQRDLLVAQAHLLGKDPAALQALVADFAVRLYESAW